jgi:hypothetical protein
MCFQLHWRPLGKKEEYRQNVASLCFSSGIGEKNAVLYPRSDRSREGISVFISLIIASSSDSPGSMPALW